VTGEVLSWGDDRPPPRRNAGLVTGLLATLALVVGGVAVARDQGHLGGTRAAATPSASPTTQEPYVTDTEAGEAPEVEPPTTVPLPTTEVEGVLLGADLPGFLLKRGPGYVAFSAIGGPPHAEFVVGWCERSRTFQDATGTYRYNDYGNPMGDEGGYQLETFDTRLDPSRPGMLLVDGDLGAGPVRVPGGTKQAGRPCAAGELLLPTLPDPAPELSEGEAGFRVITGRYVVATETRAFCPAPLRPGACGTHGWEENGFPQLPSDDLVGSYTYEGDFVVRADPRRGTIRVARLPGVRLVRRDRVGASVKAGILTSSRVAGGALRLRLNAVEGFHGEYHDDSPGPPIAGAVQGRGYGIGTDLRSGTREYTALPDVELFIGGGYTGLGLPTADAATLTRYLKAATPGSVAVYLTFDARGRVVRLVNVTDYGEGPD
jgi:hypothetical protein